jgi:hypothetical protein
MISTPIGCIFALSLENFNVSLRNMRVRLFRGVQRVKPHEGIWVWQPLAVRAIGGITVVNEASDIRWMLKVLLGIKVHVAKLEVNISQKTKPSYVNA